MKKVFSLLVVLALALSAVAFAEEAPVAGSPVPLEVVKVSSDAVNVIVDEVEENEVAKQLLDFVAANDSAAVFGEELGAYEMVEMATLAISGYEESIGDLTFTVKFAAAFEQDAKLAVLIGLINAEDLTVAWQPVNFTVEEDGSVTATLTAEQALAVQNGSAVISVLQEKAAE